jgi:carbamoyl-phosphate synthase small subunit
VMDRSTGKVEITSHNHGFAVRAPLDGPVETPAGFGRAEVSHVDLNDDVVEGLNCLDIPAFSVQYHPESAAGPHDSTYLFDRFLDLIKTAQKGGPAAAASPSGPVDPSTSAATASAGLPTGTGTDGRSSTGPGTDTTTNHQESN